MKIDLFQGNVWPDTILQIWLDTDIDRIEIEHTGGLIWDDMQAVKNHVWGEDASAIEVFPPKSEVINTGNYRHLWRVKDGKSLPSMLDSGSR